MIKWLTEKCNRFETLQKLSFLNKSNHAPPSMKRPLHLNG